MTEDRPTVEAVPDSETIDDIEEIESKPEPEGVPYQVVLSIGMVGDPTDQVQLELTAKMTALVDAMRTRFPDRVFEAQLTDYVMNTETRQI